MNSHSTVVENVEQTATPGSDGWPVAADQQEHPAVVDRTAAPEESEDLSAVAGDAGMSTVEYAVGTVVAAAFAAVLYRIVTGDSIVAGLTRLVQSALDTSF